MENKTLMKEEDNGTEAEEFPEDLQCCVCLDLLYKPVVLACGHISCFWCIYKSMNLWDESNCPICRHPFSHFPSICQLLHFILLKLYPVAYKRRERQVGEEEKKGGDFSPQFDYPLSGSHVIEAPCLQTECYSENCLSKERESSSSMNSFETIVHYEGSTTNIPATSLSSPEATHNSLEHSVIGNSLDHGTQKQISVTDFACAACKKLLFRPVVLNCGHVYCKSCISRMDEIPRCHVCQSMHPNGFPSVCLILEHLIEEQFPQSYAQQREISLNQANCSTQTQQNAAWSSSIPTNSNPSGWFSNGPKVHFGVGCDSCGMLPIIGERYKCKDCPEKIGFDLCEVCYATPSKIQGRFNQKHKPEHKFEIVQPLILYAAHMILGGLDN